MTLRLQEQILNFADKMTASSAVILNELKLRYLGKDGRVLDYAWVCPSEFRTDSVYLTTHTMISESSSFDDILLLFNNAALSLGMFPEKIKIRALKGSYKRKTRYSTKIKVFISRSDAERSYLVPSSSLCTVDAVARKWWHELTDTDIITLYTMEQR